ncbi:hypothetical protein M2140_000713 [Clostridiales Family XIII bacterium PM5-7]
MKKIFIFLITLIIVFSTTMVSFAGTEKQKFDVNENCGLHTTAAVIVRNGVPYFLSEEEYRNISSVDENIDNSSDIKYDEDKTNVLLRTSYYYQFVPKSKTTAYVSSEKKRVSPIFERASSLTVSSKKTFTRKVVESGGLSISAAISGAVDAGVKASYNYKKSATSTTSSSVTGTFKPSGKYRYSAVVFTPRIATITGECRFRQEWQGTDSILSRYNMTWKYPVNNGTYLDGIYKLQEANSTGAFPD